MNKHAVWPLPLLLVLFLSQILGAQTKGLGNHLEDLTGRLYLNHKSLSVVYSNLHDAALDAVNGSDQQLGYIQKTYLFVSEANLICYYQWELLSIDGYIKDSHRSDYYTLRIKDLKRAIFECRDRLVSLELYSAYIENHEPRRLINEAVGLIRGNIYMFEDLVALLQPLANPHNPYASDPLDS